MRRSMEVSVITSRNFRFIYTDGMEISQLLHFVYEYVLLNYFLTQRTNLHCGTL